MPSYRDIVKRQPTRPKPVQLPSIAASQANGTATYSRILKKPNAAIVTTEDMQKAIELGIDWGDLVSGTPIEELIAAKQKVITPIQPKPTLQTLTSPTEDPSLVSASNSDSSSIPKLELPQNFEEESKHQNNVPSHQHSVDIQTEVVQIYQQSIDTQTETIPIYQQCADTQTDVQEISQIAIETQTDIPETIPDMETLYYTIISDILAIKYPTVCDIENAVFKNVRNIEYSDLCKLQNKVRSFIRKANILPRGVCEPLCRIKIENGCKKVIYRSSSSCPPNLGRTYISRVNRKNCYFVTTESELPPVLTRVPSNHTIQTYSSQLDMPSMNQTYEQAVQDRDTLASEITRIPLKNLKYNTSLFTRFHGKAYKKWFNLDGKCNKLMFETTQFTAKDSLLWILYINGESKGLYSSEKKAKEEGTRMVSEMNFPFSVSVFQIPKIEEEENVFEIGDYEEEAPAQEEAPVQEESSEESSEQSEKSQSGNFMNDLILSIENHIYTQNRAIYELSDNINQIRRLLEEQHEENKKEQESYGFWSELFEILGCPRRRKH
jgi:hypothetical protein